MQRLATLLACLLGAASVAASDVQAAITVTGSQTGRTLLAALDSVEVLRVQVTNNALGGETLQSIELQNRTSGPGAQTQLDQEWSPLTLKAGGKTFVGSFSGGKVTFAGLNVTLPGTPLLGSPTTITLQVWGKASASSRDGDALDLRVSAVGATAGVTGGLPDPAGTFPIEGMTSPQIAIRPVTTPSFALGSTRNLALDFTVPANGYEADVLQRVEVVNLGTARPEIDLDRVELWLDDGNGVFAPAVDLLLGELAYTGERWVRGALNLPVPTAGRRMFLSVDIAELAQDGTTVRLALPPLPDVGLILQSANDGPIEQVLTDRAQHALVTVDRITLATKTIDPGTVLPGDVAVPLLQLVATNTYSVARQLVGIAFANATLGPGAPADRDGEFQSLTLREDGDDDGQLDPADPVLGTALFLSGRATFTGIAWNLPPGGASRRLFLTGDVALLRAADGDVLAALLQEPSDLSFATPTSVAASWPLSSGAAWTVDGMRAAQIGNLGAAGLTVGPGQGPVEALDVLVRRNGYQSDVLTGVAVENLGTAAAADVAEMRLWRDGGDGSFGAGAGDDVDLGVLSPGGGAWTSGPLAVGLAETGARLFVSLVTSADVADSATVRLALRVKDGLEVQSDNDGPHDVELANPDALLLSERALLASLTVTPAATTVGQVVTVRMSVRNVGGEAVNDVTPSPLAAGAGGATLQSGPTPAFATIPVGGSQVFTWSYSADAPGEVAWSGSASGLGAVSNAAVAAHPVTSNTLRVFDQVTQLELDASAALPVNVSRGQTDVVPFYLAFAQSIAGGSDVLVRGLRVRLESETGAGIVPAELLSGVSVQAGVTTYLDRSNLETSGDTIDLALATPIQVSGADPITVAIALDLAAATTVPSFRVVIADSAAFTVEDATSGAPVSIALQNATFPLRTGLARVVEAASRVDVASLGGAPLTAGPAQANVSLLALRLDSPGVTGVTSDARVISLAVRLADTAGVTCAQPGRVLRRLKLRSGPQTLVDRLVDPAADSVLTLLLSPLLSVPVNTPIDVQVVADLADSAALGRYRLALADSASFEARDPNSGDRIAVRYVDPPLFGPTLTVEAAAESLVVRGVAQLPAIIGVGSGGVPAVRVVLRHPGPAGSAALALGSVTVRCVDEARNPLTPAVYVERLHVRWNGVEVASLGDPPGQGNAMDVALPALAIAPLDVDTLELVVDFEAAAPPSSFELSIHASGLPARDVNTGLAAVVVTEPNLEFPLLSGLGRLAAPARSLVAGLVDRMPTSLAPDGGSVAAAEVTLLNDAPPGAGGIVVDRLVLRAADAARRPIPLGAGVERLSLYRNGAPWAPVVTLAPGDSTATLSGDAALALGPGAPAALEVRIVPRSGAAVGSLRLGFVAADVGVVQPQNPLLAVAVQPPPARAFPLWTEPAGFSPASLEDSYSNFPNPFAAGRQLTTFAYYLPRPGRVTLRMCTARGERVVSLLDDAARGAGLHQQDAWDGRNGSGHVVTNGVYVAELVVRFDDGTGQRLLRKIAVLR